MNSHEQQRPKVQDSPGISLIIMAGCISIAETFAHAGIDAIKTGAPELVLI